MSWLFALAVVLPVQALSAPFIPTDDSQVLERLPDRGADDYRAIKTLAAAAAADPGNADAAAALADAHYRISRREGDPRYLGYAQAALARWWKDANAPTAVLVTRATLLQSSHDFPGALADLDTAIARDPGNARAVLVRATILTVVGRYDDAEADCRRLLGLTQDFYVLTCVASVDALRGNAIPAKAALEKWLSGSPGMAPKDLSWIESVLGEIAHRLGDASAETHFRAALAADPDDLYTIGAYADWLLDHNRAAEVIPLVETRQRVDGLLLRLALAQRALGLLEADNTIAVLRDRYDASRLRGDTVHRREEARFQLLLNGDAAAALRLARDNWNVQREPADLRILAEAAHANGDAEALDTVRRWLAAERLEYRAVAELAK
jgi:hypothetical protein